MTTPACANCGLSMPTLAFQPGEGDILACQCGVKTIYTRGQWRRATTEECIHLQHEVTLAILRVACPMRSAN